MATSHGESSSSAAEIAKDKGTLFPIFIGTGLLGPHERKDTAGLGRTDNDRVVSVCT